MSQSTKFLVDEFWVTDATIPGDHSHRYEVPVKLALKLGLLAVAVSFVLPGMMLPPFG